jgi:hypothetical protein
LLPCINLDVRVQQRRETQVPGTEADLNEAVVAVVDELLAYVGPTVRSITIHVQASGEYPYSYLVPGESVPGAGMATVDEGA